MNAVPLKPSGSLFDMKAYQIQAAIDVIAAAQEFARFINEPRYIVLEMPTGMGKTVVLADVIGRYLAERYQVIVLTPGAGGLDSQTAGALARHTAEHAVVVERLTEASLSSDSRPTTGQVFVANWESLVSQDRNTGLYKNRLARAGERTNIWDFLGAEGAAPVVFIVDEAHHGKAKDATQIQGFLRSAAETLGYEPLIIEASATPLEPAVYPKHYKRIVVPISEGRKAGLIRANVLLNQGMREDFSKMSLEDKQSKQTMIALLQGALDKQEELREAYVLEDANVWPLIGVQVPNSAAGNEAIERTEDFFRSHGIHVENHGLAKFLDGNKSDGIQGIASDDSPIRVLIYKQAISTGWDCPRAQIAVGFRSIKSTVFSIQNRGRYFRTTHGKFFANPDLNTMYLYSDEDEYSPNVANMDGIDHGEFVESTTHSAVQERFDEFTAFGLPTGGTERRSQDVVPARLVQSQLAVHFPAFASRVEIVDGTHAARHEMKDGGTTVEAVNQLVDVAVLYGSLAGESSVVRFTGQIERYITEPFTSGGVSYDRRDFSRNSRVAERVRDTVRSALKADPTFLAAAEDMSDRMTFSEFFITSFSTELEGGVEMNPNATRLQNLVHSMFTGPGAPTPVGMAGSEDGPGADLDNYAHRFNGTFSPAPSVNPEKLPERAVTGERASRRLYQPDLTDGDLYLAGGLSNPETAFEEYLVSLVDGGVINDIWFERNNIGPRALCIPVNNGSKISRFFPDYFGVIEQRDGTRRPFVIEIKGKNPEAFDKNDAGMTRAKGEALTTYGAQTGAIAAVAYQSGSAWATLRREDANAAQLEDLIRTGGHDATAGPVIPWSVKADLPADLSWFFELGK